MKRLIALAPVLLLVGSFRLEACDAVAQDATPREAVGPAPWFDTQSAPFNPPRVRHAVRFDISIDVIAARLTRGAGLPLPSPVPRKRRSVDG